MIALAYCVVKLFFANIKRGGILLCQIAVGSLYMFSFQEDFPTVSTAGVSRSLPYV